MSTVTALLIALGIISGIFIVVWAIYLRGTLAASNRDHVNPALGPQIGVGFFANFMDTLGVGSFAITSSIYKLLNAIPDDLIPGTMNVGHALPTVTEAFIFLILLGGTVDPRTLAAMIAAAVLGAYFGAGIVSGWPKRKIQIGLGIALIAAAILMLGSVLKFIPIGGDANGLTGTKFFIAVAANFFFGAIQQLGVGLYAPCMILIYLLGMNQRAAFPIMMGSCAFLMPVGGYKFIKARRYSPKAALGLTLGGIPAVFLAAFIVKSLPLTYVKWLVVFVVLYTAIMLLRSAMTESAAEAAARSRAPNANPAD
ncbi:MAG TPA: sulfite exporter TauE/SafE family protein [Candidatus Sulfotelmatobacter sp.]|nr:sulfite exporter TauE/SafE family protein [Candidatus Sulfotelmatobacter sp.]